MILISRLKRLVRKILFFIGAKRTMNPILEEIVELEDKFIRYDLEDENYFGYKTGTIPILISAPHGAIHWRINKWKEEDEYTASIAIKLADLTGAYVIYVKNATKEDPNYVEKCKYKEKIIEIVEKNGINFILDLHGADKKRNFKVCVGIVNREEEKCTCPTFKNTIQEAFSGFQEDIFMREGLTAAHPGTITYFARKSLGIESAQFEINAKYRIIERRTDSTKSKAGEEPDYRANENDVLDLIKVLERTIVGINKKLEEG